MKTGSSHNSLSIKWEPPVDDSVVHSYLVEYRKKGESLNILTLFLDLRYDILLILTFLVKFSVFTIFRLLVPHKVINGRELNQSCSETCPVSSAIFWVY